jgi:hypothetical protein
MWSHQHTPGDGPLSRRDRIALDIHGRLLVHPDYRDSPLDDIACDAVQHADALIDQLDTTHHGGEDDQED